MEINKVRVEKAVKAAKSRTNDKRWIAAIDRAAEGILSGELIVTTLADGAIVTSKNGTYRVTGRCTCKAAQHNYRECRHRAAARLVEMMEAAPELETEPAPRVVHSIERDVITRRRLRVTRVDGWMV